MTGVERLAVRGVRKTFGANVALAGLDLTIEAGQTHALVGQNGSGKSTLVKVLAGVHRPDAGTVAVNGLALALPASAREARRAGLSFVHQSLGLVAGKTVAENIAVGDFALGKGGWISWRTEYRRAGELLERIGADIDPRAPVGSLGPADQSKVAIARAIRAQRDGQGVLVLDEPSRALPPDALREFHRTVQRLVAGGAGVLLISHNLEEVMAVADTVSVLRDGVLVASGVDTGRSSEQEIAQLLLGHQLVPADELLSERVIHETRPVTVRDLDVDGLPVEDLTIRRGEIVGITGLAGDRWERLPYALAGAKRGSRGCLEIGGRSLALTDLSPRRAIDAGVALVPEQRLEEGLAVSATIAENVALPWYRFRSRRGLLHWKTISREVLEKIRALDVRPLRADAVVGQLSGGNQQKVLLGKWLMRPPALLLLHEPTQAVDVGARDGILRAVRGIAGQGAAVLYASAQPTDLAEIADRILSYRDGRFTIVEKHTQEAILEAVYPTEPSQGEDTTP